MLRTRTRALGRVVALGSVSLLTTSVLAVLGSGPAHADDATPPPPLPLQVVNSRTGQVNGGPDYHTAFGTGLTGGTDGEGGIYQVFPTMPEKGTFCPTDLPSSALLFLDERLQTGPTPVSDPDPLPADMFQLTSRNFATSFDPHNPINPFAPDVPPANQTQVLGDAGTWRTKIADTTYMIKDFGGIAGVSTPGTRYTFGLLCVTAGMPKPGTPVYLPMRDQNDPSVYRMVLEHLFINNDGSWWLSDGTAWPTTTTLTTTPEGGKTGSPVTLTATVDEQAAASTGGTVEFFADGTSVGTAAVTDGSAKLTTTTLPAGDYSLSAKFTPDAPVDFAASTSKDVDFSYGVVSPSSTPTITGEPKFNGTLSVDPGEWADGAALSYQWNDADGPIEGATGSTLTLGAAQVGQQVSVTVTGTLDGYEPTSRTSDPVGPVSAAPSTTTVTGGTSTTYGHPVSWAVTVAGDPTATGSVTAIGSGVNVKGTLSGGKVILRSPVGLAVGNRAVTFKYSGDAVHDASQTTRVLSVAKASTRATLTVTKKPTAKKAGVVKVGLARVAGAAAPSGKVTLTIKKGAKTYTAVATARNGVATVKVRKLPKGTWTVKATYVGDTHYRPALSKAVKVNVKKK